VLEPEAAFCLERSCYGNISFFWSWNLQLPSVWKKAATALFLSSGAGTYSCLLFGRKLLRHFFFLLDLEPAAAFCLEGSCSDNISYFVSCLLFYSKLLRQYFLHLEL
jgi:hypothetical protein